MKCKRKKGRKGKKYSKGGKMSYKDGGKLKDACWDGYEAIGTKKKDGKEVPNCVPKKKK